MNILFFFGTGNEKIKNIEKRFFVVQHPVMQSVMNDFIFSSGFWHEICLLRMSKTESATKNLC